MDTKLRHGRIAVRFGSNEATARLAPAIETLEQRLLLSVAQFNPLAVTGPAAADVNAIILPDSSSNQVNVLANNSDPGHTMSVTAVGSAQYGTAALSGGEVIYTPDLMYTGPNTSPIPSAMKSAARLGPRYTS